jgi:hypothetical protein
MPCDLPECAGCESAGTSPVAHFSRGFAGTSGAQRDGWHSPAHSPARSLDKKPQELYYAKYFLSTHRTHRRF